MSNRNRKKVPCPDWARFWRVDEVIECLPVSEEVRRELLVAMPDAYDNKRPPDRPGWKPGEGEPRNELPPEPDTYDGLGQSLRCIWCKLTHSTKHAIVEAYNQHPSHGENHAEL